MEEKVNQSNQKIPVDQESPFGPGWRKVSSSEKGFWGIGGQFDKLCMDGKIRYNGKDIWIKYD